MSGIHTFENRVFNNKDTILQYFDMLKLEKLWRLKLHSAKTCLTQTVGEFAMFCENADCLTSKCMCAIVSKV